MTKAVLALAVLLASCGGSPLAPDATFRLIGYGSWTQDGEGIRVISDEGNWRTFVAQSGLRAPSNTPDAPLAPVNFTTESVVALMLGLRPTAGYVIEVERLETRASKVVIHARERVPCVGATVITYPMAAVAVPKLRGAIEVSWTRIPCQPS